MGLVLLRGRAELRARWRSLVVLAVLVGIGGGLALTALAGARRTDSAVSRFAAYSLADDGGFQYGSVQSPPASPGPAAYSLDLAPVEKRVVSLPEVAAYFRIPEVDVTTDQTGRSAPSLDVMASADSDYFHTVDRPRVVAGHLPRIDQPFAGAVNELAASKLHLRVGSALRLYAYSASQIEHEGAAGPGAGNRAGPPAGPAFTIRIAAVFRLPTDVNAGQSLAAARQVSYEGEEDLYLTPAFLTRYAEGLGIPVQQLPDINLVGVRLRHGAAGYATFATGVKKVAGSQVFVGNPGSVLGTDRAAASAQRATHLEALSLLLFGLLAALITVLLVGQAVSRQVLLEADDHATLRSLGASRKQLIGLSLMRAGLVGGTGGLLAFAAAAAASPLMPVGLARQAEIHPGFQVDPVILGGGAAVLAALVAAWPLRASWQVTGRKVAAARGLPDDAPPLRAAEALARKMVWPAAEIGVRFGLQRGRGRTAVPVASAALTAVLAVAALVASLTFGSSLAHLESSPSRQGWNWDVLVGNPTDFTDREAQYATLLSQNRLIGSYSAIAIIAGARQGNAYIDNVALDTMLAFDQLRGSVHPTLIQGRPPQGLHEIVLGTKTLAKLHKTVGQAVQIDVGPPVGRITLHIVGAMVSPSIGDIFTNSLGDGGWISGQAFKQVQSQQVGPSDATGPPPSSFGLFAVRYAPGVSPQAAFASLQRQFGPIVLRRLPPEDVINLHSVNRLPLILAGLVALLGTATIGHTLVTSVRRRRRDLAVLKTVGFVRGQVGAAVAWQATSFVVLAMVIGVPLGVALGRWAWHLAASGINSTSPPTVPALAIALVIPGALVVANLLAAGPGWAAARVAPARVLRSE